MREQGPPSTPAELKFHVLLSIDKEITKFDLCAAHAVKMFIGDTFILEQMFFDYKLFIREMFNQLTSSKSSEFTALVCQTSYPGSMPGISRSKSAI